MRMNMTLDTVLNPNMVKAPRVGYINFNNYIGARPVLTGLYQRHAGASFNFYHMMHDRICITV